MSDAPETIWTDGFDYSSKPTDTIGRTEYRRADLTATDAQALANPKVVAMVEALIEVREDCIARSDRKGVVPIGRSAWEQINAALTDALDAYKARFIAMIEDDT